MRPNTRVGCTSDCLLCSLWSLYRGSVVLAGAASRHTCSAGLEINKCSGHQTFLNDAHFLQKGITQSKFSCFEDFGKLFFYNSPYKYVQLKVISDCLFTRLGKNLCGVNKEMRFFWHRKCWGVKKRAGKIGAKIPFFNPQFKLQLPNEITIENTNGGLGCQVLNWHNFLFSVLLIRTTRSTTTSKRATNLIVFKTLIS